MRKQLVNTPDNRQEIITFGEGGGYFDKSRVFWCWKKDGEPPIKIDLGFMERVEKVTNLVDNNGKKQYRIVEEGEHKTQSKKVPLKQVVVYLLNKKMNKMAKSTKPPVIIDGN